MTEYINIAIEWIKKNIWLSAGIGIAAIVLLFPKLFKATRRRRRRANYAPVRGARRAAIRRATRRAPKRQYSKAGKRLKAWQIKGSLAAKRHMAAIRRKR